ncbi:hypothetical protein GQ457_14G023380 [Hibiscus cannabinus]
MMEGRLEALERQSSENQSYLKRILSLMSREAEVMSTPTPSPPSEPVNTEKAAGKKAMQVTILDDNERYSFHPEEPGVLAARLGVKAAQTTSEFGAGEGSHKEINREPKMKLGGKHNDLEEPLSKEQGMWERNYSGGYMSKPRIEFQTFDGTNPRGWIRKCQKYFAIFEVPENQKLELATMYLVGKAETWFDGYMMQKNRLTWREFISDLCHRFGDRNYGDVVS